MELYLRVRRAHFQDGLSGRRIARDFGISRNSVAKMLMYSEPPGYRRIAAIKRPKLDAYINQIDQWLTEDKVRPRKQRHTAKRIFEHLRYECRFDGGYSIGLEADLAGILTLASDTKAKNRRGCSTISGFASIVGCGSRI